MYGVHKTVYLRNSFDPFLSMSDQLIASILMRRKTILRQNILISISQVSGMDLLVRVSIYKLEGKIVVFNQVLGADEPV